MVYRYHFKNHTHLYNFELPKRDPDDEFLSHGTAQLLIRLLNIPSINCTLSPFAKDCFHLTTTPLATHAQQVAVRSPTTTAHYWTSSSSTAPVMEERFLATLGQQHKQAVIIGILFILFFILILIYTIRTILNILRKQTPVASLLDGKFLFFFIHLCAHFLF